MLGTVSRTCASSRKPSRDSTPVTRTADWANWRTCCRTPWYLPTFSYPSQFYIPSSGLEAMLPPCVHRTTLHRSIWENVNIIASAWYGHQIDRDRDDFVNHSREINTSQQQGRSGRGPLGHITVCGIKLFSTEGKETPLVGFLAQQCHALPQAAAAFLTAGRCDLLESSFAESSLLWHIYETAIFTPPLNIHTHIFDRWHSSTGQSCEFILSINLCVKTAFPFWKIF